MTMEPDPTEPETVRRQPLLAVPGWLLLGCLFLPTLQVCGDPVMPIAFPPSYAVYLGGLMIALIGGSRLLRSRRRAFSVLLSLWTLTLFAIATISAGSAVIVGGLIIGCLLVWVQARIMLAMFRTAWSETAIGIGCLVQGVVVAAWSALLASDPDGMWGAHVALWSGVAIVVASAIAIALARAEVAQRRLETEPAPLPQARAIVRD